MLCQVILDISSVTEYYYFLSQNSYCILALVFQTNKQIITNRNSSVPIMLRVWGKSNQNRHVLNV